MVPSDEKTAILESVFDQLNEAAGDDEIAFGDMLIDFIALTVNYCAGISGSHEHSLNALFDAAKERLIERGMYTTLNDNTPD